MGGQRTLSKLFDAIEQVQQSLVHIDEKLKALLETRQKQRPTKHSAREDVEFLRGSPLDAVTLLKLSDKLRKTAIVLCRIHQATAEQISKETQRERAVESSYLNQLVELGYISKRREGRTVYFYLP